MNLRAIDTRVKPFDEIFPGPPGIFVALDDLLAIIDEQAARTSDVEEVKPSMVLAVFAQTLEDHFKD
jgi:hypothetical protein